MNRRHAVAVLSAAMAALAVSGGAAKVEKPGLTIGLPAGRDDAPVMLPQLTGVFVSNRLAPVVTVFRSGPSTYPAPMNGSLDIGATNYAGFSGAVTKKMLTGPVVAEAYAATTSAVVLLTPPNSAIHSPADPSGRTIASRASGNIRELLVRALSRGNNLDPNSSKFVPIHFPDAPGAPHTGQVDAVVEPEPAITGAERDVAAREPFPLIRPVTTGMPPTGCVAGDRFISADPEPVATSMRTDGHPPAEDRVVPLGNG